MQRDFKGSGLIYELADPDGTAADGRTAKLGGTGYNMSTIGDAGIHDIPAAASWAMSGHQQWRADLSG